MSIAESQAVTPIFSVNTAVPLTLETLEEGINEDIRYRVFEALTGDPLPPLTRLGVSDSSVVQSDGTPGASLAGRYRVVAYVKGASEVRGSCATEFIVSDDNASLFEALLTWNSLGGDLDLHLIRESEGVFCSNLEGELTQSQDCDPDAVYYANRQPDWTGSDDDPQLISDDLCGEGPEFIRANTLAEGRYLLGVDFFGNGCSPDVGQVPTTLNGVVAGTHFELSHPMVNGDFWEALLIDVDSEGSICLTNVQTQVTQCDTPLLPVNDDESCESENCEGFCDSFGQCAQCLSDDQCDSGEASFCAANIGECVVATCRNNAECDDDLVCDLGRGRCERLGDVLPIECDDDAFEPNDTPQSASPYNENDELTLCQNNTDFVSFSVDANQNYEVRVFSETSLSGIILSVVNDEGQVIRTERAGFTNQMVLALDTPADVTGPYRVRLDHRNPQVAARPYRLEIRARPSTTGACTTPPLNTSLEAARTLTPDSTTTDLRCTLDTELFYRIPLSLLSGVRIGFENDHAANPMRFEVLSEDGEEVLTPTRALPGFTIVDEGPEAVVLRVEADDRNPTTQSYFAIVLESIPRPESCANDINEPDAFDAPTILGDEEVSTLLCQRESDHYQVLVPADVRASVSATFTGADEPSSLFLLDENGEAIAQSLNLDERAVLTFPRSPSEQLYTLSLRGNGSGVVPYAIRLVLED